MDELEIRAAVPADLEALVAGNQSLAQETEDHLLDPDRLRRGVRAVLEDSRRGRYWVAEAAGGPVVGQLMTCSEWSDWRDGEFWWIESVYVDPGHRRQGIYRRLYEHVLADARRRPEVCGLRLYVDRDNQAAQSTYRALGMKPARYEMFEVDFVLHR